MNIRVDEFNALQEAIMMLPVGDEFSKLPKEKQSVIINADTALCEIWSRHKKQNRKTADYIAEKRKTNKNYARSKGVD